MKTDGKKVIDSIPAEVTDVWGWVFAIAAIVSFFIFLLAIGTRLALGVNTTVVSGVVFFLFSFFYLIRPETLYKEHVIYKDNSSQDKITAVGQKATPKGSLTFTAAAMIIGGGVAWWISQIFPS